MMWPFMRASETVMRSLASSSEKCVCGINDQECTLCKANFHSNFASSRGFLSRHRYKMSSFCIRD